jgi:Xaa-Pro aminopeptidase
MTVSRIELPRFSLAERDRRYAAVQRGMASRGLDCLVIPHNTGEWDNSQPEVRYLTCIGGGGTPAALAFPIKGEPIAIVREPRRVEWWKGAQDWVSEIRGTREAAWAEAMVQALRDLGCDGKRIGIVGWAGVVREPDGLLTHREHEALRTAFPTARFEDATALVHDIRMVKSAEEIAMHERAQACAEAVSEALFATARVGITEHELYAELVAAHIRHGGEIPTMFLIGIGQRPNQTFAMPTMRKLAPNDIIIAECEPKYAGYAAQSIESVCLGTPADDYERLFAASLDCFHLILEAARPGVPYAELIRLWQRHMEKAGLKAAPTMGHGLGLGQDAPTTRPNGDAQGHVVTPGHCFILKPWATSADGQRAIRAGNTIVIEEKGARRLGKLKLEFRRFGG